MESSASVACAYCGQEFEVTIDTTFSSQRFVTDCEVCCRPCAISVECEPGEIISIHAEG